MVIVSCHIATIPLLATTSFVRLENPILRACVVTAMAADSVATSAVNAPSYVLEYMLHVRIDFAGSDRCVFIVETFFN